MPTSIHADGAVALVRCQDYDESRVHDAVGKGLSLLGGADRFVDAGERVLLKVNLLAGSAPERAVTTHPSVLKAVAKHFQGAGAAITYGDSPGFGSPETTARRAGLTAVAKDVGIELADFERGETVSFHQGHRIKQFTIARGVLAANGLISLPKLKTHGLTRMTGAVKNQFGCIPGLLKGEFHARLSEIEQFAQMLVDLTRLVRPRLYIMDAIVAMEGNGPRSGSPRPMSALLLSTDPVALDAVACRMMNLEPKLVPTTRWGRDLELGKDAPGDLLGDPLESFLASDFNVNRKDSFMPASMNRFLARFLRDIMVPRPVIDQSRCTRCGACVRVCPVTPKALSFPDAPLLGVQASASPSESPPFGVQASACSCAGDTSQAPTSAPPAYDYAKCVRCYCCQELCPDRAITIETPLLGRLLHR